VAQPQRRESEEHGRGGWRERNEDIAGGEFQVPARGGSPTAGSRGRA
jgi:hypothetical protein